MVKSINTMYKIENENTIYSTVKPYLMHYGDLNWKEVQKDL